MNIVKSGIIGASFNDSGSRAKADEKTRRGVQKYIDRGSNCVSHVIYRSCGEPSDNKKHLYLVAGVPIVEHVIRNAAHSELEKIVVVGDSEIRNVVEENNRIFGDNGRVLWVSEGSEKELSLSNTLKKGSISGKEIFIPGDLPFFSDVNNAILDSDIEEYDAVADLNTFENTCNPEEGFLRNCQSIQTLKRNVVNKNLKYLKIFT